MNIVQITRTLAVALVLVLTATGLWAAGAEEEPAAAADKKYVTDPSTGKVVVAPEYGGKITFARKDEPAGPDTVISGMWAQAYVAGVNEKLAWPDWATPRDEFDFVYHNVPTNTIGSLAESWSQPDPLTYIVKVRQGVYWHDKPPMNGRELIADDIVYNYHRITGTGSGFTERSEWAQALKSVPLESVTATDKWTVVFKLKSLHLDALAAILDGTIAWIYPPEVIKEHGDVTDWRNLVGTGPMMLTDLVEGSSITWEKNPDYWGYDEKYPENRLPYIDQLRALFMPEDPTYLAALRTGRIDYIGPISGNAIMSHDQLESLKRTNPELVIYPYIDRSDNAIGMNTQRPPFDDIRVRKAMQMALNLEEINDGLYGGFADMTPQGVINRSLTCCVTQFEDWPEDVKKGFMYDPAGAEKLLDEAGLPRGADGIRFKTELMHLVFRPLSYVELLASYWNEIGIDVEIDSPPVPSFASRRGERDFEMISAEAAMRWNVLVLESRYLPTTSYNSANVNDPVYTAMHEAAAAATTIEEYNSIIKELDQYGIERFWEIWGGMAPQYVAIQPWLVGFSGETMLGTGQYTTIFSRLWVDSELKEAMGH
ncbi:MAG: ABC transporter substrate-binding protein [Spirochaetaceae bacterium]|nr:ABC transporter substrate-binding protein [Spirochaetaceae bacterium]